MSTAADAYAELLQELRKKRLAKGLTQAQVALGIQLSRAQYTAIERGRSLLSWKHLHNLAVFYKTTWTIRA
jgi:transcriptional regulator with XRE-family HTH domain